MRIYKRVVFPRKNQTDRSPGVRTSFQPTPDETQEDEGDAAPAHKLSAARRLGPRGLQVTGIPTSRRKVATTSSENGTRELGDAATAVFRTRHRAVSHQAFTVSFPALKRPFSLQKRCRVKTRARGDALYCRQRLSHSGMCQARAVRTYLGSSITPLLRSVILGYLTFFWSSSF